MRHKLKFGEMAPESGQADLAEVHAQSGVAAAPEYAQSTSERPPVGSGSTNHQLALSTAEGSLPCPEWCRRVTNRNELLIDTLPIRIKLKSFNCTIGAHSNRHSPESLTLHQSGAVSGDRSAKIGTEQAHFQAAVRHRRTRNSRDQELGILVAGAGGAEILPQGCYVRVVRTHAASVHGEAEALGLLDAQAGVVKLGEAVTFSRQQYSGCRPGKIHRPRRAVRTVPLSNYVEELVPVTTVPHAFLPNLPTRPIGCAIGEIGSKEFRISCLVLTRPLFRQFESLILTPALEKVAVSTAHVSIKLSALSRETTVHSNPPRRPPRGGAGARTLHEHAYGCYTFRKLRLRACARPRAKAAPDTKSRTLLVHVSSEKSQ